MQRADSLEKILMLGKIESKRKRGDRGWDGWMTSPTQWTWTWVCTNSRRWWRTGEPGVLQSMGWQRVGHNLTAEQQTFWYSPNMFRDSSPPCLPWAICSVWSAGPSLPIQIYSSLRVYGSLQLPEVLTASGLGAVVSTQLELKRLGLTHGPTPVWDKQGNKEAAWVRFPRATPYGGRDSVNPNWKKLILRSFNKWALKWTDLLIIRVVRLGTVSFTSSPVPGK